IANVFRDVGPIVSLSIAFQFGLAAMLAFLALYFVDARGISSGLAAVLFGLPQLAGVIGAPLGGYLSDRFGRRAVMLVGLTLLGPAVLAIAVVPNEGLPLALVGFGLLFAMRTTVTETLVMDTAPAGRRATVLGAYYLANAHVGGIGAPLFGFLAEAVGIASASVGDQGRGGVGEKVGVRLAHERGERVHRRVRHDLPPHRRPRIVHDGHVHAARAQKRGELLQPGARCRALGAAELDLARSGRAQPPVDHGRADVDHAGRDALVPDVVGEDLVVAEAVLNGERDAVGRDDLRRDVRRPLGPRG